ncbi:hypothetical protein Hjap01_01384 [Haloarcula japonica]
MLPRNRYKLLEAPVTDTKVMYPLCVLRTWQLITH